MKKIKVNLFSKNSKKEVFLEYKEGQTYEELAKGLEDEFFGKLIIAKANNHLYELADKIRTDVDEISLLDTTDTDGNRVYMRSLAFIFIKAISEYFKDNKVVIEHTISGGLYCTLRDGDKLILIDSHIRDEIKEIMRKLIEADKPIIKRYMDKEHAVEMFRQMGRTDKVELFKYRQRDMISIYSLDDYVDYFYGHMVPSTSYIEKFDLELFDHGIVLIGIEPADKTKKRKFIPQYKLSDAYNEAEAWSEMQGITSISKLNSIINNGTIGEVCRMSEALQQHKIMQIAQMINEMNKRIVLISAPSSSGKTSFAYKLNTSLKVLGLRPVSISLDDYYVNREDTPLDAEGKMDFESLYAIDLELFNKDLNSLLNGDEVERISFEFVHGKRIYTGEKISISSSDPIIIEGIHGLNPELTNHIDDKYKFRIYLNVITQINLDDHNNIPTTDLRLLRRMARDKHFRGKDIKKTIVEWPTVRLGEDRNIFPYQEEADIMFNSSFVFDISALKPLVIADLEAITDDHPAYTEAARLKSFLQYFISLEDYSDIVNTSILREFIGGSKIVH